MHYFSVEEIGRDRTMPTTPMALLSALDRNGLRNPDYFRSSTYLFTSNLPLVSTSTSKCYRPTASIPPCHTFRDWRNNAWLIASSLRFYHRSLRDLPISRPSVHIFFPLRLHDIILLSPIFSIFSSSSSVRLKFYSPKYTSNNWVHTFLNTYTCSSPFFIVNIV